MKLFNPANNGIKILNLRQTGPTTLLASAATKEDVEKLAEVRALKENGFSVETIKEKLPRIVIYDVPHTADGDPREEIFSQNQNIQDLVSKDDFLRLTKKISHWPTRRSEYETNWVLEVSPTIRKMLVIKGKVYMGWSTCRVADYFDAVRCFKCQQYGHVAKHCTHKRETCGHCGEARHRFPSCMKKKVRRYAPPARSREPTQPMM